MATYEEIEPDITRTLSAASSGPLGDSIPLQPPTDPVRKTFYESKDGIQHYLETSIGSTKGALNEGHALNIKLILPRTAPPTWMTQAQEVVRQREGPTKSAIVGGRWLPLTLRLIYRVDKAQGAFFCRIHAAVDAFVQSPPLPVIKQPQPEPRVLNPSVLPDWAIGYLAILSSYWMFCSLTGG